MTESPSCYDVTITVDREGRYFPNPSLLYAVLPGIFVVDDLKLDNRLAFNSDRNL
jgi:hypothetical protein